LNKSVSNALPKEIEKPLPYERLLNKKYTLGRRAYQNTVAQYNYFFNGQEELNDIILKARNQYQDDYTKLLGFYDYDLNDIAKYSIDSIVYRCNANIVLHDLRNNWVDDAYLLMAKAYLFHKDFDTAGVFYNLSIIHLMIKKMAQTYQLAVILEKPKENSALQPPKPIEYGRMKM
jgi:hypothetical protein